MSSHQKISRRDVLIRAAQASAGTTLAFFVGACQKDGAGGGAQGGAALCADTTKMSTGDAGARTALNYMESSSDPAKTCSVCAFYVTDSSASSCGKCMIFNEGPANPGGHCDSWSAKSA